MTPIPTPIPWHPAHCQALFVLFEVTGTIYSIYLFLFYYFSRLKSITKSSVNFEGHFDGLLCWVYLQDVHPYDILAAERHGHPEAIQLRTHRKQASSIRLCFPNIPGCQRLKPNPVITGIQAIPGNHAALGDRIPRWKAIYGESAPIRIQQQSWVRVQRARSPSPYEFDFATDLPLLVLYVTPFQLKRILAAGDFGF